MTIPSKDEMRAAINAMTPEEQEAWVEQLRRAAANLDNAAYGLAGNVPEAKPDPETWSLNWLHVGLLQLNTVREALTPAKSPA